MKNQRGFISFTLLIEIVLGVAVLGGGVYYVIHKQNPPQTSSDNFGNVQILPTTNTNTIVPIPSPASNDSQIATYVNAQYGFSIDFSKSDQAKTVDYGSFHPFGSAPIVYSGYWITVNASNDPTDVAKCMVPGAINNSKYSNSKVVSTYSKTINGINFAVSDSESLDPSYERNYTTLRNGTCFDIQIITVPSCSLCTSGRPSLESYKPQLDAMDKIAQTFKFINH